MSGGAGADRRRAALGSRLGRLRAAAGLDAVELATAAGLDPGYYRAVEAGRGDLMELTYLDLLQLADALRVTPATVLED